MVGSSARPTRKFPGKLKACRRKYSGLPLQRWDYWRTSRYRSGGRSWRHFRRWLLLGGLPTGLTGFEICVGYFCDS